MAFTFKVDRPRVQTPFFKDSIFADYWQRWFGNLYDFLADVEAGDFTGPAGPTGPQGPSDPTVSRLFFLIGA